MLHLRCSHVHEECRESFPSVAIMMTDGPIVLYRFESDVV